LAKELLKGETVLVWTDIKEKGSSVGSRRPKGGNLNRGKPHTKTEENGFPPSDLHLDLAWRAGCLLGGGEAFTGSRKRGGRAVKAEHTRGDPWREVLSLARGEHRFLGLKGGKATGKCLIFQRGKEGHGPPEGNSRDF